MELEATPFVGQFNESVDIYERDAEPEMSKNMASKNHGKIQSRLAAVLNYNYDEAFDIYTEFELELLGKRVVPDLSVFPLEPSNWQRDVIRGKDIPVLAIEIVSPKQAFNDIVEKVNDVYFPAGMSSVWVVLPPAESIMIFKPNVKPQIFNEGILKDPISGFDVDLKRIFK